MAQPQVHQSGMHQPIGDHVYTICRFHEEREWMLAEIDVEANTPNKWTTNQMKAMTFLKESHAEDIIENFQLKDVHIGRITVGY